MRLVWAAVIVFLGAGESVAAQSAERSSGYLFLAGGGIEDPELVARFVELAGGADARLVIVPTASNEEGLSRPGVEQQLIEFLSRHGAGDVAVLHTRDRAEANSDEFLAPLRGATGVWFWGGRAARLADAYVGTAFVDELGRLYERGGVIGGTSSGAAIQTEVLLRGDPENTDLLSPSEGFGLLDGVILDVHFLERNRLFPLAAFLKRRSERGIGIDEDTAVIIHGESFEVAGNSYVVVYGIEGRGEPFTLLSEGDRFHLGRWKVLGNCGAWTSGCVDQ